MILQFIIGALALTVGGGGCYLWYKSLLSGKTKLIFLGSLGLFVGGFAMVYALVNISQVS